VDELVAQKLYDEAISLLNQVDEVLLKNKVCDLADSISSQDMRLWTIKYLKAFALFEQKRYDEAMDLFSAVSSTPRIVISLFPPIIAGEWSQHEDTEDIDPAKFLENAESPVVASAIPQNRRASLDSPRKPKDGESDTSSILSKQTDNSSAGPPGKSELKKSSDFLEGKDLMRATLALIRYLADMRFKLSRWLHVSESTEPEESAPEVRILFSPSLETQDQPVPSVQDLEDAAELVDTTLFRAYMLCRPQLVGPLVRRPNRCVPSVVQSMLEQTHVRCPTECTNFRNTEILRSFCLEKDFIDRRSNSFNPWDRKRSLIPMQFQLVPLPCRITFMDPNTRFCISRS
jgi:tetratricopeptide (TPR) repeat protein